ncbi:MAG: sensor histidine kinase [Cyanobacteria bacterium J06621_11]
MKDLGYALLDKLDDIIELWVKAVRADTEIDSIKGLTYEAVHNGLPDVLRSVATLLTVTFSDEEEELEEDALEHGNVRAEQGFDLTEVVREYRILRNVVVLSLEPELASGSVLDALKAVRQIDSVIDKVVLMSLESYMDSRFAMLEKMHAQLLLTNQELTRLVQSQKDNVSHLAHELKNPLNSIISFSSLLLRKQQKQLLGNRDVPLEMKQIERIFDNGRQLLRLINNTLEVSRAGSEQMALSLEVVQVSSLVRTVMEALRPAIGDKDIELAINCEQGPNQVTTDSLRLQQILTNLVSNAIRYTDSGNVTVASYVDKREDGLNRWALVVCDTGRGISEEMRSKIFEPYVQAEGENLPESSGLGLTIVNKLVQLLQGEIQLESTLGQGSTFTVRLPIVLDLSS